MQLTQAMGVTGLNKNFEKIEIQRRDPKPNDVVISISHCGICHSDIHTARGEWGGPKFPCVPGHEIVGHIVAKGAKVKKHKIGDAVGVGCFVDSCGKCESCKKNEEQFCEKGATFTYNSAIADAPGHSLGGYSNLITVNEKYVLKIKKGLPLDKVAPLLCAGITTYSPLKRYKTKKGHKVGVVGLGGLGHMAVKLAKAMGAEVTVFSTSPEKEADAKKLGAKHFVLSKDSKALEALAGKYHLIINSVSAQMNLTPYLRMLKMDGTMVMLGVPPEPNQVAAGALIGGRKKLTGSLIGGIKETQEMLDFCAKKKVFSEVEVISAQQIDQAYERTVAGQVKYRFVIDMKTL